MGMLCRVSPLEGRVGSLYKGEAEYAHEVHNFVLVQRFGQEVGRIVLCVHFPELDPLVPGRLLEP